MKFEKGKSGNPSGRPKETEQEKVVKTMTKELWLEMSEAMMTKSKEELSEIIARGVPYEMELFIIMMLSLAEKGDWHAYQKYLDRRIGKIKEEIGVNVGLTLEGLVAGSMKKDETE